MKKYFIQSLLFLLLYFWIATVGYAQQYSQRDQAEIKYLAQLTLLEYEGILNLVSNSAISPAMLKEAVQSPYTDSGSKIFYSANVPVEDALAPSRQGSDEKVSRTVQEYFREFNEQYVKSDLETIDFYNFEFSNLKKGDYLYIRAKYTAHFKGRHKQDPALYKPVDRVATIRVERKGDRLVTYIVAIAPYSTASPISSSKDEVALNNAVTDNGTFTKKLEELLKNHSAPQQANDAAIAQSWSAFDDKRFEEFRQQGELAERSRDYETARRFYAQALLVKPGNAAMEQKQKSIAAAVETNAQLQKKFNSGDYVEAIKAYSAAIASAPENADFYYGRGRAYEQLNELQTAIKDFTTAINLDNRFADALKNRAQLYIRTSQPKKALEDYNQIVKSYPETAVYYPERAKLKLALDDKTGALTDYETAIRLAPQEAKPYYEKGLIEAELKQTDKAIKSFSDAIHRDSLLTEAYYARGLAYIDQQTISSAAADFEKARKGGLKSEQLAVINNFAAQYVSQGEEAMQKGNYKLALENFIKRILLAPEDENAWIKKGEAHLKLSDTDNALQSFTKSVALDKVSLALYHRGLLYLQLDDEAAAKNDFEKFVPIGWQLISAAESRAASTKSPAVLEQLAVEIADGWYHLGNAQLLSGQYNEALTSLDKSLDINKSHARAMFAQGAAQLGLQNYKKAIRDIEKSLKLGIEDSPHIYLALGDAYQAIGQTQYAISIYTYLIESVDKKHDKAYTRRAAAFKSLKQYPQALQDLNTAMTLNGALKEDVGFITNKGMIELYESKFQEASKSFDQALSLEQDDAWALYGKASILASQNKMEESLDLYRKAFQTGKIEWSAIKDDPIIKHVSKQKAFKDLVDASLRL